MMWFVASLVPNIAAAVVLATSDWTPDNVAALIGKVLFALGSTYVTTYTAIYVLRKGGQKAADATVTKAVAEVKDLAAANVPPEQAKALLVEAFAAGRAEGRADAMKAQADGTTGGRPNVTT